MVAVAGFAMIATAINPFYCVVPLGMAVVFPTDPATAAFVGMVVVLFVGAVTKLVKSH